MIFNVSSAILENYKASNKNYNYMLDYLLSAIDPHHCKQYFRILSTVNFGEKKKEVKISYSNVKYINSLFGFINDELVERLLWVALLLQEI